MASRDGRRPRRGARIEAIDVQEACIRDLFGSDPLRVDAQAIVMPPENGALPGERSMMMYAD